MQALAAIWGKVMTGRKLGRVLGYPTANIKLHKNIPDGIYASKTMIAGKAYYSATFIGVAKMFGETEKKAEAYILDFDGNLYGQYISIYLYKKIRENGQFASEDVLKEQIKKDVEVIETFFAKKNNS